MALGFAADDRALRSGLNEIQPPEQSGSNASSFISALMRSQCDTFLMKPSRGPIVHN